MGLTRSEQMARIRGRDTAPEMRLRQALWRAGLRFRLKKSGLAIRPDLVFGSTPGIAVFIDGCFWHGCPDHYVPPRSAIEFWSKKLAENVERDRRQTLALEAAGWRVLRFWECEVIESLDRCIGRIRRSLQGSGHGPGRAWRVARIEWLDEARNFERRWLQDLHDPTKVLPQERRRITSKARLPKATKVAAGRSALRKHGERGR
jgi:DNA mismatch endonuclease (patch repair protein)